MMFGLGKNKSEEKNKKPPVAGTEVDSAVASRIHVMPERFYVAPKSSRLGLFLLIGLGLVVIGILSIAAFYLNEDLKRNRVVAPTPSTAPPVTPPAVNQPPPEIATTIATTTTPLDTPTTTSPLATTTDDTSPGSPSSGLGAPLPAAVDADGDGLTEVEEELFGTNPAVADTDGDTYPDGPELLSGYDPTRPKQSLAASTLIRSYTHPRYTIIYPSRWTTRERDSAKNEVMFITETGEFITVLTVANPRQQVLPDWYREQFPGANVADLTTVKIGNLSGLRTPDQLSYYFADPNLSDTLYLLTYNIGNRTTTNFSAAFSLMVKSFQLLP